MSRSAGLIYDRRMSRLGRSLWLLVALGSVLWVAYIVIYYGGMALRGDWPSWNLILHNLYRSGELPANLGIGLHLAAGAIITLVGPLQLLPALRARAPRVHRVLGRIYIGSALIAGLGGTLFILLRGTLGGPVMSVGFGIYGVLIVGAALLALHHARRREIDAHRRWALRLFALGLSSWLYRLEYSLWALFADMATHTERFDGAIDWVMDFFFYAPTLAVTELYLRLGKLRDLPAGLRVPLVVVVVVAGILGALALFLAALGWWWPKIELTLST